MTTQKWLHVIAFILVIVGAVNTFLIALVPPFANGDAYILIDQVFGFSSIVRDIVYTLVFVSAAYLVVTHAKDCKVCGTTKAK